MDLFSVVANREAVVRAAEDYLSGCPGRKDRLELLRELQKLIEPGDELDIPEHLQCERFQDAWDAYVRYRRAARHSCSGRALKGCLTKLEPHTVEEAIEAMREAELSSWKGLFPKRRKADAGIRDVSKAWKPRVVGDFD